MTGSLIAVGASAALRVLPGNTITVVLDVTAAQKFEGVVALERSVNGQQTWEVALDINGTPLVYTGESGTELENTIVSTTVLNDTTSRAWYRVRIAPIPPDATIQQDGVNYAVAEVTGDLLYVLLYGRNGEKLVSVRDDGGLYFHGPLVLPFGLSGAIALAGGALSVPSLKLNDDDEEFISDKTIAKADIIGTSAGQFGHAAGYPLVADPGANKIAELVSGVWFYDRVTATYGDGGNVTINENGGAALTGLISAGNSVGAGADKYGTFHPLAAAGINRTANKGLNLVSSAAFTDPGTAAGTIRVITRYRIVDFTP